MVGNDVAVVITSSPGTSRRPSSFGLVSAESATRFAEDPEFTRVQWRTPTQSANSRWNWAAKRPEVSQKSSADSMRETMSSASNTRPAGGTGVSPGTNSRGGCAAAS